MFRHLHDRPAAGSSAPPPVHSGPRRSALGLLLAIVVVQSLVLAGCGSDDHTRTNQSPRVAFFGSPVEGDSVNYVVDFTWIGWDDDGSVVRSEYAVDIPGTFTPEQINDPATPGIEWVATTSPHARIRFSVNADTGSAGGGTYLTDRASAPHTFFVRVYDNRGAYSTVADRSFNAWTILPRTTITWPTVGGSPPGYFIVNGCFSVRYAAEDADGPAPDHRPVRTEYKLIPVRGVIGLPDANYLVNMSPGPQFPWLPASSESDTVIVYPPPGAHVLALRSIDEAGGVESRFQFGQNAALMQSSVSPTGRPTLTIDEPVLGRVVFPRDGTAVDFEMIAGTPLEFEMSGDATAYGGTVGDFRWCVDSGNDPSGAGDIEGCESWSAARRLPAIRFDTAGVHTISFAVRDGGPCGPSLPPTWGTLRIRVVPRAFDREVLYVDDYFKPRDPGAPDVTDSWIDERTLAFLRNAGYTDIHSYDAWGTGDLDGSVNSITLDELSRYRLVFWSVLGAGGGAQNGNTALLQASSCATGRVLRAYVAAGGALWINGEMVFGALKDRSNNLGTCLATTAYTPDVGLSFGAGSFVTDYLHISGGDFRDAKTGTLSNGLLRARPTSRMRTEGFPILEADSTAYAYAALGGLNLYDAMFQPTYSNESGLDTLYTAEAVRNNSAFSGKPIAWRYADPSPTPRQGAVAITSFPLHRMKPGAASRLENGVRVPGTGVTGLVEVMAAWFRAHDATQVGAARLGPAATRVHARHADRAVVAGH